MAGDRGSDAVLEGATMLRELFADEAGLAIERRVAWALDCARIEDAMYWLAVRETIYGQPYGMLAAQSSRSLSA
jgi:hypothetical protein